MIRLKPRALLVVVVLFITSHAKGQSTPAEAESKKLLRLPGATLLVGNPPRSLHLVTGDKVIPLQDGKDASGFYGPSISLDGSIVAAVVAANPNVRSGPGVVRTYSVKEKKWMDHQTLIYGRVSISPDGTRLAFQADESMEERPGKVRFLNPQTGGEYMGDRPSPLRILDIQAKKMVALSTPRRANSSFSWAPDGRRLAIDGVWESDADETTFRPVEPSIYAVDVPTGSVTKIAGGISPAWSPSGEWIAFVVEVPSSRIIWRAPRYRLRMVHPDGTGARDLMDFGSWALPNLPPVWSPDSKTLLLNVSNNPDEGTFDIYQLDVETRKHTRRVKGTRDLVFGWVKAN